MMRRIACLALGMLLAGSAYAQIAPGPALFKAPAAGGGRVLPLVRTFNQPIGTTTPAVAFWTIGHPFIKGEVPSGSIVTATLGGTAVPVMGIAKKLESDNSLAWTQLMVDLSGINITTGSSKDLVLTSAVGSWSTTTARTNADWAALVDTVEITSLTTTGTAGADMNGAGTWVAKFDNATQNTVETYGSGPLGLYVKVTANFVNGATTHRYLQAVMEYWVTQKADTTLGPIASKGPFIQNNLVFKTPSNPSEFDYTLTYKRGGVTTRSEVGVKHPAMSAITMPRYDGLYDWTASDPKVWVSQDYTKTRKTKKIPPLKDGIVYTGGIGTSMPVAITGINTTTGIVTVTTTDALFGPVHRTVSVDFTATVMPVGLSVAPTIYWAVWLSTTTFQLYNTLGNALLAGATGKVIPTTAGTSVLVSLNLAPTTSAVYDQTMADASSRPDISLLSEWGTSYHIANTQNAQRLSRVMAYSIMGAPFSVINDATGKIPSMIDAPNTPAGLGTVKPNTFFGETGYSTDIGGGVVTGLTNSWQINGQHWPNAAYSVWLMEGGPVLRDVLLFEANRTIADVAYLPERNFVLQGTTYYASIMADVARVDAWNVRDIAMGTFAATQGSAEETYYRNVLTVNTSQVVAYNAYKGTNYTNFGALNYDSPDYPPETNTLGGTVLQSFMQSYAAIGTAFAAVLQGDFVPGLNTVADFTSKFMVGLYTAPQCPYFATIYTLGGRLSEFGTASPGTYVSSFAELGIGPSGAGTNYSYTGSTTTITMDVFELFTPVVGDKFRPANFNDLSNVAVSVAPSPLVDGTDYYVKTSSGGATFTISATPGGAAIVFGSTVLNGGGIIIPVGQTCPGTGTVLGGTTDADGYLAYERAALAIQAARGATGAAAAFTAADGRWTGNFNTVAQWGFQASY